ncbi:MAG: DUF192 domain-containing protein, partial [Dehalococcoidia bacterium]
DVEIVKFDQARVSVVSAESNTTLTMLVADTFERRTRGLMHRSWLPVNTGMIFAFPAVTTTPFWNRDTPMSLDIAFLNEDGIILEILALEALSTDLVAPEEPYLYAVELPLGWFAAENISRGDRFQIPDQIVGSAE